MPEPDPLPSPRDLARVDVAAVVRHRDQKQGFVTPMFEHIAPRYDAFTRYFSFGMDARWKTELLALVPSGARDGADLACGTGDLAIALGRRCPGIRVTGIDAATAMIERARHRAASYEGLHFQVGDLTHTPLPEGSLDVITAGYAYRNVPDLSEALTESRRLLRPGGTLCTLDFYRPAWPPWRRVFLGYLHVAGSAFGWWWHRAPVIYNYIATSIDAWVTIAEWERTLAAHGFEVTARRSHLGGGVAVHTARRR